MLNIYSQEENQRAALQDALTIYLYFRLRERQEKKDSEKKTVQELIKRLHVTEDFAKQAVSQMWN